MGYLGKRTSNYVAIDTTGLDVQKGRDGVFLVPNDKPLNLRGRIVGFGENEGCHS
ncbi:MAG: hypothetical protein LBE53_04780 [Paucimonas sp.]|nr:hypothetical protein [Paucimonas sp.]